MTIHVWDISPARMEKMKEIFLESLIPCRILRCDIPPASSPFSCPITSSIEMTVGPLVDVSDSYHSADSTVTGPDNDKKPDVIAPELFSKRLRDW